MKLAVLKPVMWNDNGYMQPAGCRSIAGYSHDNGYGHEEWNGNPDWMWHGYRIFHTESTSKMLVAAETGDLAMVMITSHQGITYALGIAVNIFSNNKDERQLIAGDIGKHNEAAHLWQLPSVKKSFANENVFHAHWDQEFDWIQWKCLSENYFWLPEPVALNPMAIVGKPKFAMYHSRCTYTTPEIILDIVDPLLPRRHTAIRDWLAFGDFDLSHVTVSKSTSQSSGSKKRHKIRRKRNAPSSKEFEYWVKGNRKVEPLHYLLQSRFVNYLETQGVNPLENEDYIDLQYVQNGNMVFSEIKPTENVETRYAIRAAIGQLLEYRFKHNSEAKLEIVIGSKPSPGEVNFVNSLDIKLAYFDKENNTFVSFIPEGW